MTTRTSLRWVGSALVAIIAMGGLLSPQRSWAVEVAVATLPPARIVEQTANELAQQGCSAYQPSDSPKINVPPGKPYRVVASNQTAVYFFCTPTVVQTLTVRPGKVEGIIDTIGDVISFPINRGVQLFTGKTAAEHVVERGTLAAIQKLATIGAGVGKWLFGFALDLLQNSLSAKNFITNPMVVVGWSFMQGIANLGFLIALLFIALSTTLGIDNFSMRRTLPRLLVAAILINFSLVIAGTLIDIARIFMAIFVNVLVEGSSLNGLSDHIRENTSLIESTESLKGLIKGDYAKYDGALSAVVRMLMFWTMALAVLAVAITLLVRYVMLILLLIVAPLAYLAFAFPFAGDWSRKWWQQFLKYVSYGPVALFLIVVATQLSSLGISVIGKTEGLEKLLTSAVMIAVLILAASISKSLGGAFGVAAVNFATGKAKQVGRGAWRAGTFLPRLAGRELKKETKKQVGDFVGAAKGAAAARMGFKKGDDSLGKKAGKYVFGKPYTPEQKRAQQMVSGAMAAAPVTAPVATARPGQARVAALRQQFPQLHTYFDLPAAQANARIAADPALAATRANPADMAAINTHIGASQAIRTNPALTPVVLANQAVTAELKEGDVDTLLRYGDQSRKNAVMTNVDVTANMSDATKTAALAGEFGSEVARKVQQHVNELYRKGYSSK